MQLRAEYLYSLMVQELNCCFEKKIEQIKEAEHCFHIADRYWAILRQELAEYEFSEMSDEIEFFKCIKPKFTSEIEFYSLVFHVSLPLPDDTLKQEFFWTIETTRLKKFIECHQEFYHYYKSGDTCHDSIYFVRCNSDLSNFPSAKAYDIDSRANTSHDPLVASILALERYNDFVRRLKE